MTKLTKVICRIKQGKKINDTDWLYTILEINISLKNTKGQCSKKKKKKEK